MANLSSKLAQGFETLLKAQGEAWLYNGCAFLAIAQSGAYAAYNFVDGNSAIRILRARSNALPTLPIKGDILVSPNGNNAIVQRSRQVDNDFIEIEVDEI